MVMLSVDYSEAFEWIVGLLSVISGILLASILFRRVSVLLFFASLTLSTRADEVTDWLSSNMFTGNVRTTVIPDANSTFLVAWAQAQHVIVDSMPAVTVNVPAVNVTVSPSTPEVNVTVSPNTDPVEIKVPETDVPVNTSTLNDNSNLITDNSGALQNLRTTVTGFQSTIDTGRDGLLNSFNGKVQNESFGTGSYFSLGSVTILGQQQELSVDMSSGWMGTARVLVRGVSLAVLVFGFWFMLIKGVREGIK